MLGKLGDKKLDLKTKLDKIKVLVKNEVLQRDLSEEKIKNASLLGIELSKFKGYQSPLDYYSFKSEFEKFVVPRVQAKLLPDLLKNNYLEGQALQIVREINDTDLIWKRLKSSFGNVTSMLNEKFEDLENDEPLVKLDDEDEKLVQSLTKIKNRMVELSELSKKHDVENSLYHSSNLAKIFRLIGRDRQTKIMRKSTTDATVNILAGSHPPGGVAEISISPKT